MNSLYTTSAPQVGLNALLLHLGEGYRSAGVSRYIHSLLTHLPRVDGALRYHAFLGNVDVSFPGWRQHRVPHASAHPAARIAWEQSAQPLAARRLGLDLLHAPLLVGPLVAPCPVVVSVHDLSFFRYPRLFRPLNRYYLQPFTRLSVRRAALVLASSESTRRDVVDILGVPVERVRVVPLGVEEAMRPLPADEVAAFRRRQGLPERFILFVGTLEPRKNLPTLLEAFARLCADSAFGHTLVVGGGKGWYYDDIAVTVERLGLRERVLFPGFVPDAELPLWYNAADLFVYPSLYEGFGLPPLEAMACGVPVVVSDSSSLPEVVADAGLKVPPYDVDALAAAMRLLLEDIALRARCREQGLARAREFSWARAAERTAALYRQVLGVPSA